MSLNHAKARQPEVIRATQKDALFLEDITGRIGELLELLPTSRRLRLPEKLAKYLAGTLYYGLSTIFRLQTLGEEYTGMIQVDRGCRDLPQRHVQIITYLLDVGGEDLVRCLLQKIENEISHQENIIPEAREKIQVCLKHVKDSLPYWKTAHRAWFYIFAGKYHISKRITGINYLLVRYWINSTMSMNAYRILGVITLLQLGIVLLKSLKNLREDLQRIKPEETLKPKFSNQAFQSQKICVLCLEPRTNTSSTPCGHLFCWHCIMDSLDQRNVCPVCREAVEKRSVVPLMNYS
ncbi:peroxisome biogenesis factor 10 [Phlebotomus papatasi]|uniref:peroxisome biogenesis factor 10 n=1 Tax=Phlebotomus papatasi TaxID=29031 RepID=UPI0024844289|nr:peroxisome biogenesis factor 10 [Phlebotomus papatasi]